MRADQKRDSNHPFDPSCQRIVFHPFAFNAVSFALTGFCPP